MFCAFIYLAGLETNLAVITVKLCGFRLQLKQIIKKKLFCIMLNNISGRSVGDFMVKHVDFKYYIEIFREGPGMEN